LDNKLLELINIFLCVLFQHPN